MHHIPIITLFSIFLTTTVFADYNIESIKNIAKEKYKIDGDDWINLEIRTKKSDLLYKFLMQYDSKFKFALESNSTELWKILIKEEKSKIIESELRYHLARNYIDIEEYKLANNQLDKILEKDTSRIVEIKLFKAFCLVKMDEISVGDYRSRARIILKDLIANYPEDGSERHREMAIWFIREIKGDGPGPLLEISKAMNAISRLIRKGETGSNPTQKTQEKIVKTIQNLIDMMEKKEGGKGHSKCPKCKGKGCRHCQKPGSKSKSQFKNKPLDKSKLPAGSSKIGKLSRNAKRGTSESRSSLKKRDRAKVLDILKEKFPYQYREIIEQYYKHLNK